ncbi:MAG: hypothetical protein K0U78_10450 [Actinomycetia bacterium]|nr:hypothetical protein [Actinomycetes bacterium]
MTSSDLRSAELATLIRPEGASCGALLRNGAGDATKNYVAQYDSLSRTSTEG